ncbi:ribonuclease domain-containing protein [Endozoicomonadaceae bacterium StTr2]
MYKESSRKRDQVLNQAIRKHNLAGQHNSNKQISAQFYRRANSLVHTTIGTVKKIAQFVKPANKVAANGIISSTGKYHSKGVIGGGKKFGNYEKKLPTGNYTEYDVNPYDGKNRDAERLVVSDTGKIYYTDDHYSSFSELKS